MVGEIIFQVERGKLVATGREDGSLSLNVHNNPPCGPSSSIWIALDEAELDWLRFQIVRLQRKTCRVAPKTTANELRNAIEAMDAAVESADVAALAGQVAA